MINEDEMLSMKPGKELNALVTKYITGYTKPSRDKKGYIPETDFDFSGNLGHAEYVLDIIRQDWFVEIHDCGQWGWRIDLYSDFLCQFAVVCPSQPSIAEAICKAGLLAVSRANQNQPFASPWVSWYSAETTTEAN